MNSGGRMTSTKQLNQYDRKLPELQKQLAEEKRK